MASSVLLSLLVVVDAVDWTSGSCNVDYAGSFPTYKCAPGMSTENATVARAKWVASAAHEALQERGAIVIKGVEKGQEFEDLIDRLGIVSETVYKGTSPRNPLPGMKKAMSSADIEPWVHIPHHAEMSFLAGPPEVIAFYCVENQVDRGGESMTMDYISLWEHLKSELSEKTIARFSSDRFEYLRKYSEFQSKDISIQKTWVAMFRTNDTKEATVRAEADGYEVSWSHDPSPDGDGHVIHLRHSMPPLRKHPQSGQMVFHNHIGVLHHTSFYEDLKFSAKRYNDSDMLAAAENLERTANGTDVTWASDGAPVDDVSKAVRDWAWSNSVFMDYKAGDVVILDNFRVSHARTPFLGGPRTVATLWGNWSTAARDLGRHGEL